MKRLVFAGDALKRLRGDLLRAAPFESAAFLLAGQHRAAESLLVREVVHPPADAYVRRDAMGLTLAPRFIADVMKRARRGDWSLVMSHTHPGSTDPAFSPVDERCERELIPVFFGRVPAVPHATLVVGDVGQRARVYDVNLKYVEASVRTVGSVLRDAASELFTETNSAIFDRNVRSFGKEGQARLGQLHIGIVGVGGTGSVVAQELGLLGVQRFTIVDPDQVELTNLNRLIGATRNDVGRPKVDVMRDYLGRIAQNATVRAINGDVTRREAGESLLPCDVIFCCTDSHGSRAVLNHLAYAYYIPTIDVGVVITAEDGRVTDITGRVQLLAPGLPCLLCGNLLDAEQVRQDFLSATERQRDPYIVGARVPQPAVVSINATVSSLAVSMFLAIVTAMPLHARYQIYRGVAGTLRSAVASPLPDCIVCSSRGVFGRGDSAQPPWRAA